MVLHSVVMSQVESGPLDFSAGWGECEQGPTVDLWSERIECDPDDRRVDCHYGDWCIEFDADDKRLGRQRAQYSVDGVSVGDAEQRDADEHTAGAEGTERQTRSAGRNAIHTVRSTIVIHFLRIACSHIDRFSEI